MTVGTRTPSRPDIKARGLVAAIVAVFILNALLVLGDFIETRWAFLPAQISLELVGLLALITALRWWNPRISGALQWLLAAVVLSLIIFRLADIVVPWSFGRNFNIALDMKYGPFFIGLLYGSLELARFVASVAAALLILLAALTLLRWSIGTLVRTDTAPRLQAFAVVALLALAAYTVTPSRYDLGRFPIAGAVADMAWRNANYVLDAKGLSHQYLAQIRAAQTALPQHPDLAALKGRNVFLVFVESYGAITLTDPGLAAVVNPVRASFEEAANAASYHVYSSLLNSPITGGGSWMAHATMTTGARIDMQPRYDVLLTTESPTLARYFRNAGYRTAVAMPRIQQPWPEGAFFGFDTVLNDNVFAYAGTRFSWETIPDQFVLESVHAHEIASAKMPLFIQYVLSSSHLPFDRVPPLIDDASALGDGRIYDTLDVAEFPPPAQVFANQRGYAAAIRYSLESLSNYLSKRLADDSLIIILGDHQPPLTIAAESRNKAVPIHVLSRDPALLEPFRRAGYAPGMTPPATATTVGMESFLAWFLKSYSSSSQSASAALDGPRGHDR